MESKELIPNTFSPEEGDFMFKSILSIFISITLVSTGYAQVNSTGADGNNLPQILGQIVKQVQIFEDQGYYLQNNQGEKMAFGDFVRNKNRFGAPLNVYAPPERNESGKPIYQLKMSLSVNGSNLGIKMDDALDDSTLGRTVLKLPKDKQLVLENEMAIKALLAQVKESLKPKIKISKNDINSQGNFVNLFFSILFPKAHAGLKNAANGLIVGFGGIMVFAVAALVFLSIAYLGINWIGDDEVDMDDLKGAHAKIIKGGVVFGLVAGGLLMIIGLTQPDGGHFP